MAYADIQNKVGQIQMANRVLLAQRMNPNLTPETDLSGFQEQGGYAPDDDDVDLRDFEEGKSVNEQKQEKANERKQYQKNRQANKEAKRNRASSREAAKREWERRKARGEVFGDMPPDFNLMETLGPSINTLLQIGGAIGGGLRFLNPLGNQMAMNFEDTGLGDGGFVGTSRTNVFINSGGEAYILEPNGNFKFDGLYAPEIHGPIFPRAQANDDMKIAKLPHSPPVEKIVLPNGKLMDSPLRFKTDQERIKFMEDFSRGYGRYS